MTPRQRLYRDGFLKSPEWAEIKRRVFDRDQGVCAKCGSKARPWVEYHHEHYGSTKPGSRWPPGWEVADISVITTYCPRHHREEHTMTLAELQARIALLNPPPTPKPESVWPEAGAVRELVAESTPEITDEEIDRLLADLAALLADL